MMVLSDVGGVVAATSNYENVEAGEIVCSSKGLFTDRTTAFRIQASVNNNKDGCFMTKYPLMTDPDVFPVGTEDVNYCMFCGASN